MENDPFASLTLPPLTSSQQQMFETCPFAHEDLPENQELQLKEAQVEQSMAIVAASLTTSLNDDNFPREGDKFQTASANSHHGSSQEPKLIIPIVDLTGCGESSKRRRIEIDVDIEMEIEDGDLGRLNVPVRICTESVCENAVKDFGVMRELPSPMKTKEKDVVNDGILSNQTMWKEKDKSVGVRTETACENVAMNIGVTHELTSPMKTKEKDVGNDRILNNGTESEEKDKSVGVLTETACENVAMDIGVTHELPSPMKIKEKEVNNDGVLNNQTKSKEKDKSVGIPTETVCENATMHIEVRRELPSSMTNKKKDVGNDTILNVKGGSEDVSSSSPVKNVFNDIFLILKRVVTDGDYGVEDSDEDFLEIAKRRGMNFPRPSWWPPEGFRDDDD